MNTVNTENFNETCKGYMIRACRIEELNRNEVNKILNGLRCAFDEMTMSDARREYEKYMLGKIEFNE